MYKWGYFPAVKHYGDIDEIIQNKGYVGPDGSKVPYILWAGRFLDWKHPELAVYAADHLKRSGIDFHMDIIGNGPESANVKVLFERFGLEDKVTLLDFMKPEEVRAHMEKANILLFTSDRNEGWGAVLNEAMNSGCAVIADNMIGAAPYLVQNGVNGCLYDDGKPEELFKWLEALIGDPQLCDRLGHKAYDTMVNIWSPEKAADAFWKLMLEKLNASGDSDEESYAEDPGSGRSYIYAPCMMEYPRSERRIKEDSLGTAR